MGAKDDPYTHEINDALSPHTGILQLIGFDKDGIDAKTARLVPSLHIRLGGNIVEKMRCGDLSAKDLTEAATPPVPRPRPRPKSRTRIISPGPGNKTDADEFSKRRRILPWEDTHPGWQLGPRPPSPPQRSESTTHKRSRAQTSNLDDEDQIKGIEQPSMHAVGNHLGKDIDSEEQGTVRLRRTKYRR